MKFLLFIIAMLLICTFACAATINFAWDPMPSTESWSLVRIYERTGPSTAYVFTKVAEVPATATTAAALGVTSGTHSYLARSVAADGTESADSNVVTATLKPGAPTTLRFTIP